MRDYFFIGQVLMPKRAYAGQNLNIPVSNGAMPIQPHMPMVPVAASVMSTTPATIRKIRSIPPTLSFMFGSLYGLRGMQIKGIAPVCL
ncbi:MAG: hypothetical protein A2W81_01175 [Betaproteobacteria bacterium RIFCSPLOWO2_12_61_14]|nr:MAG: hypothetical protein A2W81_01175 [Betaproteobacteria bacterium RIFCSPLOWO2_12_61_14]